ncbi:tumor protein p63-regulated gene 1-like protein isoform X2 [Phlebotomus argentipes]|uniref:tumor protein p63-regulated gene 1-like protein isoform X2 n=1 Tax=Phlebotomus argentipes TaxID=94469 RepID=UPI002892C864|nr:tumor protein p63-regulated gene 1-like protein isoform X2 [Phlebotomus argentipes]
MYRSQEVHPSEPRAEDSVEDNYEFRGATLTISSNDDSQAVPSSHTTSQPAVQTGKDATTPTSPPEQPRASICEAPRALVSAESIRPRIGSPRHFFCFRNGLFEQAIKDCTEILLKPSFDSDILGNWLLTEISHWDHERERIVILTTKALYVIKFDFIALRILKKEKILMNRVDTIIHGKLTYPTASFVPDRNEIGVRLMWNKGQPIPAATSWNPFATDIPWKTFTNHPIHGYQDQYNSLPSIREEIEANRKTYSVEHLHEALVQLINNPQPNIESANINYNCQLEETPIVLENYVGIGAVFHNKNNLGFFKVRGKFSF